MPYYRGGFLFIIGIIGAALKVFQHQWAASQHKSSKLDILHSTCTIGPLGLVRV